MIHRTAQHARQAFENAYHDFLLAGERLLDAWDAQIQPRPDAPIEPWNADQAGVVQHYPKDLPSLDELLADLSILLHPCDGPDCILHGLACRDTPADGEPGAAE